MEKTIERPEKSQTTTISVRVDESVKREVEVLFEDMGMNISTAINMFFRQSILEGAIPFQPRAKKHKSISLKERLKDYSGDYKTEEWDTGEPVGREVF